MRFCLTKVVVFLDDRIPAKEKATVWDCVCIGSDFDGLIDPLSAYPTALAFPQFAEDLEAFLRSISHTRQIEAIGVETLVKKICWQNIHDFALKHMPT